MILDLLFSSRAQTITMKNETELSRAPPNAIVWKLDQNYEFDWYSNEYGKMEIKVHNQWYYEKRVDCEWVLKKKEMSVSYQNHLGKRCSDNFSIDSSYELSPSNYDLFGTESAKKKEFIDILKTYDDIFKNNKLSYC